jgi:glyoxylase-like metal-dependent hydrolase (beta-lactamase superfamily II)
MLKRLLPVVVALALVPALAAAQDAKAVLESVAKAMGATDLTSIRYSGSGQNFAVGQNFVAGSAWPRFIVKSYTRSIDYASSSARDEIVRTQGENPPRGDGPQPVISEQRLNFAVSGALAWNTVGANVVPRPIDVAERRMQIWITPHGVIKAALAANATVQSRAQGGRKTTVIAFSVPGQYKATAIVNDQSLVERVEAWVHNPVLGDTLVEATYAGYRDVGGGVKFPTTIRQSAGGFPSLDITVGDVVPNAPVEISAPDSVRQAAVRVDVQKAADGVWFLAGGSHNSVAIEMKDWVLVVEGPQDDVRAAAVLAAVLNTVPGKPIRYVVNSHHHFDHAGGLAAFAAEGITIITHEVNKPLLERALAAPRTVSPDRLARSGRKPVFETVADKRVITDGTRTLEIHHLKGSAHHAGLIAVYLPKEKILIEADAYTPTAPNAPYPAVANVFTVNLNENIERLGLAVDRILPLHGRMVPLVEMLKAIGKAS